MKKDFYAVVAAAAKNAMLDSRIAHGFSLQELHELSCINRVCGLVYQIVGHWKAETKEEEQLLRVWKEEATEDILREYQKIPLLQKMTELAYKNRIPILFFKGHILADLYPAIGLRTSGDTDIYVDRVYEQQVMQLLHVCGYEQEHRLAKENVLTYYYRQGEEEVHKIELHFSLFEDLKGEDITLLTYMNLTSLENCVPLVCCGIQTLSMGHTQHLIYQIFHMVKHFVEQGIPMRYMLDVSLFCNHYEQQIDIPYFWECMKQLGYVSFCQCFFSICQNYFEMSEAFMQGTKFESEWLQQAMEEDFLYFGTRRYGEEYAGLFYDYVMKSEKKDLRTGREESCRKIKQMGCERQFLHRIKMLRALELLK